MTFDELYEVNPTFRAFTDAIKVADRVRLEPIWRAGGSRKGRSPRHWWRKYRTRFGDGEVEDRGETGLWADADAGLHYIQWLDVKIMRAVIEDFGRKLRRNPAYHVMGCPDEAKGLMGMIAVGAMMAEEGMGQDEARRHIVAGAVEQTDGMDSYAQETAIAKVQRAVGRG